MAAMLTINLLPESYRKASHAAVTKWSRLPVLWVGGVILVGLPLVPAALGWARQRELTALTSQVQGFQQQRVVIEQARALLEELRDQEAAFSGLTRKGNRWSRRLNIISDVTPEGVWFNELVLQQEKKRLVIDGSVIAEGGSEMMRVGRLVQDLKSNEGFSDVVSDIQIESIKRVQEREVEVVRFTLTCSLADRDSL